VIWVGDQGQQDDAARLNERAVGLWHRYARDGDLKALEEAVSGFRAAADGRDALTLSNPQQRAAGPV